MIYMWLQSWLVTPMGIRRKKFRIGSSFLFIGSRLLWSRTSFMHLRLRLSLLWPRPQSILGNSFWKNSKKLHKVNHASTQKICLSASQQTTEYSDFSTVWLMTMRKAANKKEQQSQRTNKKILNKDCHLLNKASLQIRRNRAGSQIRGRM